MSVSILFNILINGWDDGAECTHSMFANAGKPGVADTLEGHAAIQRTLTVQEPREVQQELRGNYPKHHQYIVVTKHWNRLLREVVEALCAVIQNLTDGASGNLL